MKITLSKAIKEIKKLGEEIDEELARERNLCETTYRTPEEKIVYDYDFAKIRNSINEKTERIIKLKKEINIKNNETKIGVLDYTIADGLVLMPLLRKEIDYSLASMSRKEKLRSSVDSRNEGIVYTELLYDPTICRAYLEEKKELISRIQLGIDTANLNVYIEV